MRGKEIGDNVLGTKRKSESMFLLSPENARKRPAYGNRDAASAKIITGSNIIKPTLDYL